MFAVHDEDAALDIVQDSMMKLAEKYGDKPAEEFPMLFQRILQNSIRDYYRRQKVRSTWTTLLSSFSRDDDDSEPMIAPGAEQLAIYSVNPSSGIDHFTFVAHATSYETGGALATLTLARPAAPDAPPSETMTK